MVLSGCQSFIYTNPLDHSPIMGVVILKRIRMKNKKETFEHDLSMIDLSIIEAEINLDKKIRVGNIIAQIAFSLLIGSVIATIYLQLVLFHII